MNIVPSPFFRKKIHLLLKKPLFLYALLAFFSLSLPSSCAFLGHKKHKVSSLPSEKEQKENLGRALSGRGTFAKGAREKGEEVVDNLLEGFRAFFRKLGGSKATSIEYPKFNAQWKVWGENILQRGLTEIEAKALSDAYYIKYFLPGNDLYYLNQIAQSNELRNFTNNDIKNLFLRERKWILNQAGFTEKEINFLLEGNDDLYVPFDSADNLIDLAMRNSRQPYDRDDPWRTKFHYSNKASEQLRESLENGELKEGINPFIMITGSDEYSPYLPYKIIKINDHYNITVQGLNEEPKVLTHFSIGHLVPTESYQFFKRVDIASPEVSQLFAAMGSNRRRVTIEELNLPRKKDLPPPPSSYGPEYTAGWTQIQEGIAFARGIRKLDPPPNPYKTHIEWFVPQISDHIEYARQGLRQLERDLNEKSKEEIIAKWSNYWSDEIQQLSEKEKNGAENLIEGVANERKEYMRYAFDLLNELEEDTLKVIREEQVTYQYWIDLNIQLSDLFSNYVLYLKDEYSVFIANLMNDFPLTIALPMRSPAQKKGLGIMSLNKANQNGVAPAELTTRPVNIYDNKAGTAARFFLHDLHTHGVLLARTHNGLFLEHVPIKESEKIHLEFMNSLEGEERMLMENIYFLTNHEDLRLLPRNNYILED